MGSSKISYLDGLRGIASVIVSIQHFFDITHSSIVQIPHRSIFNLFFDGHLSVTIFFILSGRVLVYSAMKRNARNIETYAKSIIKRPARLAIPVIGGLLLTQILVPLKAFNSILDLQGLYGCSFCSAIPIGFTNLSQFVLFLSNFFLGNQMENLARSYYVGGVIWTIPVELAGSWMIFLMAILAHSIPSTQKRYLVFALVGLFFWYVGSWNFVFLLGLFISDFCLTFKAPIAKFVANVYLSWPTRFVLVVCFFVFYTAELPIFNFFNDWKSIQYFKDPAYSDSVDGYIGTSPGFRWDIPSTSVSLVALILMILIEITPLMQKFLSANVLDFYGRISFGYYLGHPFALQMVMAPILKKLRLESGYSVIGINTIMIPIYLIVATIFGFLFYRLLDVPAIACSNYFSTKFIAESTDSHKGLTEGSADKPKVGNIIEITEICIGDEADRGALNAATRP